MQLRRRKRATALAFVVVAGVCGAIPGAVAAPPPPDTSSAPSASSAPSDEKSGEKSGGKSRDKSGGGLPSVWPRPQSLRAGDDAVTMTDEVALVTDGTADSYALNALRALLRKAGVRQITRLREREWERLPKDALVVRAGETAPRSTKGADQPGGRPAALNHALDDALTTLGATPRTDLPSGGYRLAVGRVRGRDTVALAGAGEDGLFHAVQTLRQLIDGRRVAGVVVHDWPGTAVRGTTEGFYGTPWTQRQRLAQLDFMGRTKQNRYVYAPGDDLYRQARWREPYPPGQRARFRELTERARRNHVTPVWAVAPGQEMCLSSDGDIEALTRKLDTMWALGMRAFQLQFQDVSYSEWSCDEDADAFGSGPEAAARAHARVANAVARHLAGRHPGPDVLSLMPTEYYQDGSTAYRRTLADELHSGVEVVWTGVGVVPRTITGRELAATREAFGHPLVTMDNYPINDYAQDRIFLGPYTGREPAVATGSAALLANAMEQAKISRIPLFTAADFAWNPREYRAQESWRAAIGDLAGGDEKREEALWALAGNDASSVLGGDESAYLRPLLKAFWQARTTMDRTAYSTAARRLRAAFTVMRETPRRLSADSLLGSEVAPWAGQLARYGEAGRTAVDMLRAQTDGDTTRAWRAYRALDRLRAELDASRVTVGEGVLDPFLTRAREAYEAWAGLDHEPAADRAPEADGRTVRLTRPRELAGVTVLAAPGTSGTVEARVPGEGWRRLGDLADGGATEIATRRGLRANAVRVTGPAPSRVHHLVPWYGDSPDASLELTRPATDVEIGGGTERVTARLTSRRPADVRGKLTVRAPKGIKAGVPRTSTLPRGTTVEVPVSVTVPAGTPSGTYPIRIGFGDETRTLTVRAFPRTAGSDLVRTGRATSSGDETEDFPATEAGDGDPDTRWSSPAEDDAWWQVELAKPVRLGQVVLRWQDAYASAYRVQVSRDGRDWHTAATVDHGRGGRESVRMDARDTRFIRVQGVKRATRYGYSLWSVEAYAVAD
ncbi:hyaluronidase [Streptomyces montanus]|uniref:Hyaluronidase n=1 Tax=Streptomyces montanus TaxID=2580423 RepID=A0A5R9FJC1_9ACTN|nr:beta-N-acetylglucosaminidase domain-containing protein [Streptomyces montanus]TLS43341.1 hyaluronidase [Streptomyces montanus]